MRNVSVDELLMTFLVFECPSLLKDDAVLQKLLNFVDALVVSTTRQVCQEHNEQK